MQIELSDEQLKSLAEMVVMRILDISAMAGGLPAAPTKPVKRGEMNIKEVAAAFGVTSQAIRAWMRKDLHFPAPVSVGRKLIWDRLDIERHKAQMKKFNREIYRPRGRAQVEMALA